METDTKEKQIIEAGTKLLTETMDGLGKSRHGWWQLPCVLMAIALSLSVTAIALKFDPNAKPTQDPYKGLQLPTETPKCKQPEHDNLPICVRRGDGFSCGAGVGSRTFAWYYLEQPQSV